MIYVINAVIKRAQISSNDLANIFIHFQNKSTGIYIKFACYVMDIHYLIFWLQNHMTVPPGLKNIDEVI